MEIKIDSIEQQLAQNPDMKTCKSLLKQQRFHEEPFYDVFHKIIKLLDSEIEYVRIFAVHAISQLTANPGSDYEKIYSALLRVGEDWSKRVVTYGLIPAFIVFFENAAPFLDDKAEKADYYHDVPNLQRVYFVAKAKYLSKHDSPIDVRNLLVCLQRSLFDDNPDIQQGIVSAVNSLGSKHMSIIQEFIENWINTGNLYSFGIVRKVFQSKIGACLDPQFIAISNKNMETKEAERELLISKRFSTEKSKERVVYRETLVTTLLHYLYVPMLPFSWGVNPYRGCFHACEYCYGRSSHEYLGHSIDDFERVIYIKLNAAAALDRQMASPRWKRQKNKLVNIGTVTDAYQPIEEEYQITRQVIEIMHKHQNPFSITTKSSLVTRDIDVLQRMGNQTEVVISIPSLNQEFLDKIERRASSIEDRLRAIQELKRAGITVGVLLVPIFPYITDDKKDLESTIKALAGHGVDYVIPDILNLRGEGMNKVHSFLAQHYPQLESKYETLFTRGEGNIYVDSKYQKDIFNFLMSDCLPRYGLNDYSKMLKGKWE